MARCKDPGPRAVSLLSIDVEAPEGVARATRLLDELAAHGGRAEVPVLARSAVRRSWPVSLRRQASASVAAILRRQGVMALAALEPHFRRSPWRQHDGEDWSTLRASDVPALVDDGDPHHACVLGLLSCHNNGHVREAAVRSLAARGEGLPWLLLRINDWVPAVRVRATTAVVERLTAGHASALLDCLPLVWRLRALTRLDHHELVARAVTVLADLPDDRLTAALGHDDRWVRRAMLQLLVERGRVTFAQLGRALDDVDPAVRVRAAKLVPSDATAEAEALRERLCRARNSRLRVVGLERMAEARSVRLHRWIDQGLDDAARTVRETARYLARTAGTHVDLVARYRSKLAAGELRPGIVLGLAETGARDDWELLVDALAGPPAVACAAHVRRQAMRLVVRLPGCRPGLLLLALEGEPVEHVALTAALRAWMRALAGSYQIEVTAEEAPRLRELLAATTRLDPDERQHALVLLNLAPR